MRPIWLLKFLGGDGCGVAVHSERFGEGCEGNGRWGGGGQVRKRRKREASRIRENKGARKGEGDSPLSMRG